MAITLTPDQDIASDKVWDFLIDDTQNHMIIEGHAGCGKSTLTRHILSNVHSQLPLLNLIIGKDQNVNLDIHVCAPTNPAARVIADMVGHQPKTVQSLFGLRVHNDFKTGETKLIRTRNYAQYNDCLIIIDEASFIGPFLLQAIVEATPGCKVIFIGDPYQLAPPKEHHLPVFDMQVPKAVLTTVNRNKGPIADLAGEFRETVKAIAAINKSEREGSITKVMASTMISQVQWPKIVPNGNDILHVDGPTFEQMVQHQYRKGSNDYLDTKILAWTNKRVIDYNNYIRSHRRLGEQLEPGEIVVSNKPLMLGEKIYLSTDQKAVINSVTPGEFRHGVPGAMVEVNGISARFFMPDDPSAASQLMRKFAQAKRWSDHFAVKDQWADFRPLHASTVHKAQGATHETVFVDLEDIGQCHIAEDVARMLYVAASRPSKKLVFYGELPDKYRGV